MFNPVHYHCHFLRIFIQKVTCVEFKTFFIVRQIKQFYFLENLFVGRSRWFRSTF